MLLLIGSAFSRLSRFLLGHLCMDARLVLSSDLCYDKLLGGPRHLNLVGHNAIMAQRLVATIELLYEGKVGERNSELLVVFLIWMIVPLPCVPACCVLDGGVQLVRIELALPDGRCPTSISSVALLVLGGLVSAGRSNDEPFRQRHLELQLQVWLLWLFLVVF